MSLRVVPVTFADACAFVAAHHRHHQPPVGHKFSLGVAAGDVLVGVAMVGRPVARHYDDGLTLEVNRTATDGTKNANSMLYGAAWRAAKALGYRRLVTYTIGPCPEHEGSFVAECERCQHSESGASLRAAGWRIVAQLAPRKGWWTPSRPRDDRGTDGVQRTLWEASA